MGATVAELEVAILLGDLEASEQQKPRVTWRDWHPEGVDPEEMTRSELVARLNAQGVDVDEADIRFWEYQQILPRPIKHRSNNVTWCYYPRWMIFTITLLRALQAIGMPLRDIAPRLRETAELGSILLEELSPLSEEKDLQAGDRILADRANGQAKRAFLHSLEPRLAEIGRRYKAVTGKPVSLVTMVFRDDDGDEQVVRAGVV